MWAAPCCLPGLNRYRMVEHRNRLYRSSGNMSSRRQLFVTDGAGRFGSPTPPSRLSLIVIMESVGERATNQRRLQHPTCSAPLSSSLGCCWTNVQCCLRQSYVPGILDDAIPCVQSLALVDSGSLSVGPLNMGLSPAFVVLKQKPTLQ